MTGEVEFDRIAPIYDETRRSPTKEELRAISDLLTGCRTVLDAGVGTGRFAQPLSAAGFEVVGVDLSREMMRRAREKGVVRLVRADLLHLPLADASVDGTFMAHVLHLFPDPRMPLRELARVSRVTVVVQIPDRADEDRGEGWRRLSERYRELAAELGYPLPRRIERHWHTLEEVRAIAAPREVRTVSGPPPLLTERPREIGWWVTHQFGPDPVPPEVHARIVDRIRAERPTGVRRGPRLRRQHLVAWDPEQLLD